ncbi:MAG: amidohydrolase family protein [Rhodobacteraceae bacterium]|nr:amidohydrolase family protein [Paracoccaceae bacterium]
MADLILRNVLAKLPDDVAEAPKRVDITVRGNVIADVAPPGESAPAGGVALDCTTLFAVPGFINGHHHSHENFQKGRYSGLPLELWMNLVRPLKPIPMTTEQVYLRTLIGAIEALRSGTTTIVDDMNVSPILRPNHVEAAIRAYEDIGIRAHLGITLFDRPFYRGVPFVDAHFPPELLEALSATEATPAEEVLDFADGLARTRHHTDNRVAYIAAPSAPQRCSDDFLMRVRDMADRHGIPVIIHVQETRMQVVTGYEFYGATMIAHLSELGFLKPATSIIHGVWVSPTDLNLIAASGASIQHNPNSNLKLGSGLMPMREMLDRGINVSLGTDGCGSIESVDMLRVMASTALVQTLHDQDHNDWIRPAEAFHAATAGGAKALGREDIGRLSPGARADIALYDTRSIAFTPLNNAVQQLTLAETGRALRHLLIDGEFVIRDGALTRIDEAAILERIHEEAAILEPEIAASEAEVTALRAPYEAIYRQCCETPIPADILPAKLPRPPP